MATDSTTITYKTTAGAVSQRSIDETGTRTAQSLIVTAGATNQHLAVPVDVSALLSFLIYSSQAITIKTNSSGSPAQTFTLDAGMGLTWTAANPEANPLTVDITDLYFTNAGSVDATVKLSFLGS